MIPISAECARSDKDCVTCLHIGCGCICHNVTPKTWKQLLKEQREKEKLEATSAQTT